MLDVMFLVVIMWVSNPLLESLFLHYLVCPYDEDFLQVITSQDMLSMDLSQVYTCVN